MSSHTGTPQYDLQIVVPQNLKEKILNLYHCSPTSGAHLGVAKTLSKLRRTFYWVRMSTDTEEFIQSCHVCASTKRSHVRICPSLHPHQIPHTPFAKIGIDHIGPVSKSGTAGYRYIAVCTDYFSRYVIAWPTTELTAETFAKEFFENVVSVYGALGEIVSDNGPYFRSKFFTTLCKLYGIKNTFGAAYASQSQGAVERQNQGILSIVRA